MKNIMKLGNLNDCVATIRKQLEMIKHLSDHVIIDDGVKHAQHVCAELTTVCNDLYSSDEVPEYIKNYTDMFEPVDVAAKNQETIDKFEADSIAETIVKAGSGLTPPDTHMNQALIDSTPHYAKELEATFEDTENPVDLEEPDQSNNIAFISGLEDENGDLTLKGGALSSNQAETTPTTPVVTDETTPADLQKQPEDY